MAIVTRLSMEDIIVDVWQYEVIAYSPFGRAALLHTRSAAVSV